VRERVVKKLGAMILAHAARGRNIRNAMEHRGELIGKKSADEADFYFCQILTNLGNYGIIIRLTYRKTNLTNLSH